MKKLKEVIEPAEHEKARCSRFHCDEEFKSAKEAVVHFLFHHLTTTICLDCNTAIPVVVLGKH